MMEKTVVIDMAIIISCIIVVVAIMAPFMFPTPDTGNKKSNIIGTLMDKIYVCQPFPHYLLVIETEDDVYEVRGNIADYGHLDIGDKIDLKDF